MSIIDLTINEIIDLARYSGLIIEESNLPSVEDREEIICITKCHKGGIENDDGKAENFNYVMYFDSCPEEGVIPLGEPIKED